MRIFLADTVKLEEKLNRNRATLLQKNLPIRKSSFNNNNQVLEFGQSEKRMWAFSLWANSGPPKNVPDPLGGIIYCVYHLVGSYPAVATGALRECKTPPLRPWTKFVMCTQAV
jgi:hypothetical protein